jgi:hypothetical protein
MTELTADKIKELDNLLNNNLRYDDILLKDKEEIQNDFFSGINNRDEFPKIEKSLENKIAYNLTKKTLDTLDKEKQFLKNIILLLNSDSIKNINNKQRNDKYIYDIDVQINLYNTIIENKKQIGGYKNKYLKYKNKYIKLKNNIL